MDSPLELLVLDLLARWLLKFNERSADLIVLFFGSMVLCSKLSLVRNFVVADSDIPKAEIMKEPLQEAVRL